MELGGGCTSQSSVPVKFALWLLEEAVVVLLPPPSGSGAWEGSAVVQDCPGTSGCRVVSGSFMYLYMHHREFRMYDSKPDNVLLDVSRGNTSMPCLFAGLMDFVSTKFMAVTGILQAGTLMCFHIPKMLKRNCLLIVQPERIVAD